MHACGTFREAGVQRTDETTKNTLADFQIGRLTLSRLRIHPLAVAHRAAPHGDFCAENQAAQCRPRRALEPATRAICRAVTRTLSEGQPTACP